MKRSASDAVVAEFAAVDAAAAGVARDMGHVVAPGALGNRWVLLGQVFGRLVAQGVLELAEAEAAVQAQAAERLPAVDAVGRRVRMAWLLRDAVEGWRQARDRCRFAVRRALGPLLAERRPSAALLVAARAVNEAAGGPLRDAEVVAEVRREVYWAARRAAKDARRRA